MSAREILAADGALRRARSRGGPMIEALALHMRHVRHLDEDRGVAGMVLDRFRAAQRAGNIPRRPAPRDDDSVVVARDGETFAGFATYYPVNDKRLWLDVLWIEPNHRRRGVAVRLLHEVELAAQRRHLRGLLLGHDQNNAAMTALMQHAGWPVDHIVRSKEVRP